jgi:hypothetical protein
MTTEPSTELVMTLTLPVTAWLAIAGALEDQAATTHVSDRLQAERTLAVIDVEMKRRGYDD